MKVTGNGDLFIFGNTKENPSRFLQKGFDIDSIGMIIR